MGMGCKGRPEHVAVMGGAKVTRPAGRYTQSLCDSYGVRSDGSV